MRRAWRRYYRDARGRRVSGWSTLFTWAHKKRDLVYTLPCTLARLLEEYTEVLGKSTLLVRYLGSTLTFQRLCVCVTQTDLARREAAFVL